MKLLQNNLKQLIAILDNSTSKDSTMYHLQNIRISKYSEKEIELCGSDGHLFCRKIIKLDDGEEYYIGAGYKFIHRDKLPYLKLLAKEKYIPQDISQYFSKEEIKFPAIEQFNSNFNKKYPIQVSLNPELLLRILNATKDNNLKSCGVTLSFDHPINGTQSPIVVSCGDSHNLLMPMRGLDAHKFYKIEETEAVMAF